LWAGGFDVDWDRLYQGGKPQRLRLPVYPFAQEYYWSRKSILAKSNGHLQPLNGNTGRLKDVLDRIEKGFISQDEGARIVKSLLVAN
jgi:acyl transferase domain-containing protein